ncbi:MAG: MFS transporter [Methanomicrobiales archaeon]|nr:MFS transporter [Methanomicrobiales archaeon]
MRALITLYLGIFSVMALSNTIIPDLASYASGTAVQGQIFSAYFLGAFLLTLPAGIASDRWGPAYFIRAGLLLTIVSGVLLLLDSSVYITIFARLAEGVGAGLFIASAMSYINSRPDHTRAMGFFLALLNIGLIAGLIISGLASKVLSYRSAGTQLFLLVSIIPFIISILTPVSGWKTTIPLSVGIPVLKNLVYNFRKYFWLWFSSVVLVGITGAVTAMYPQFSGNSPDLIGIQIAAMSGATAIAILFVSHMKFAPIPTIKIAALISAAAVIAAYVSSWAFIVIGAFAGIIMIAQLAFLADAGKEQGTFMGLFNTSSYLGMTIIPFFITFIAEHLGFLTAFLITGSLCLIVAGTIGFCIQCRVEKICTLS